MPLDAVGTAANAHCVRRQGGWGTQPKTGPLPQGYPIGRPCGKPKNSGLTPRDYCTRETAWERFLGSFFRLVTPAGQAAKRNLNISPMNPILLRHTKILTFLIILALGFPVPAPAQTDPSVLTAARTRSLPAVDAPDDPAWSAAAPVTIQDAVAGIPITLRALHDGQRISIHASFPDPTESRMHRLLQWDAANRTYRDGSEREDVLVLKWNMSPHKSGLTLREDAPYTADVWFWKAYRSDHAGCADDKIAIYSVNPDPYAKALLSRSGKIFYLTRKGDEGDDPAATRLQPDYVGDRVEKFRLAQPGGSRADIRARGFWKDGRWTVIFARQLVTGHSDDVPLSLDGAHLFGVSRFEIAGRTIEPDAEEPAYGCGDVGELITLRFAK